MRRHILVVLSACVLMVAFAALTTGAQNVDKLKFPKLNPLQIPKVEKVTLDNGMRLYILEDKSLPLFNASVRINCGSYLENPDKVGLAAICGEVMRTGGTKKWAGDKIDEMLEGIGASVEVGIDVASGSARVNTLTEYADLGLEVLADVLRNPIFDQDKIELAKVQERTGIARRNDDPSALARREFRKLIYGANSPYAVQTEYATINAITQEDLMAYHDTYIRPENIQLAVWGDFNKDEVIQKIQKYFGDWQRGNTPVPPPPPVDYDWRSKVYYINKPDAEQSYVRIGHIGGLVSDPDYADRIVMNSILGEGFGSRLTNAVRTKLGLAYSVGGRLISDFAYPGYFFASASTKPGSTILAVREMIKQIRSMQTDLPTAEEMQKGKDGYLNSFVFNFDSRRAVLDRMMTYDFYGLPEDFLQKEKEGVENVTPEAVMAAAKNGLRPDKMIVLVVGRAEEFEAPLNSLGLGEAEVIDITIPSGEEKQELAATPENIKKGKLLLDRAVTAAGGLANFKKIETLSQKAAYTLTTPQGAFTFNYETVEGFPDKVRTVAGMMGRNFYEIRNGKAGWKTNQSGELVAMTGDDISEAETAALHNLIIVFQQSDNPYYQAVYDGTGDINGTAVEFVALVDKDMKPLCRLGIDPNGQVVSKGYWGSMPLGEGNILETYSDYQAVKGISLPIVTEVDMDGQKIGKIVVSEYGINVDLPADTFEKPQQ